MPTRSSSSVYIFSRCPVLPPEIMEKILSYLDGRTLLSCEKASPELLDVVQVLASRNVWRKCCDHEIPGKILFQIASKIYPHYERLDYRRDWRTIYDCWFNNVQSFRGKERITKKNICKEYTSIQGVFTHASMVMIFVEYNKNYNHYNKIYTLNDRNQIIDKSARFTEGSIYITPIDNSCSEDDDNFADTCILLPCDECKLIGIPVDIKGRERYPKIKFEQYSSLFLCVEHANKNKVYCNCGRKFNSINSCRLIKTKYSKVAKQPFIHISNDSRYKYITCQNVTTKISIEDEITELRSLVTCYGSFANFVLLGTKTGMLYCYICMDELQILDFKLEKFVHCFNVSSSSIVMIDFLVTKDEFQIICCDSKNVYRIEFD